MTSLRDIREAANAIAEKVHRTPLLASRTLGDRFGCRLSLKPECFQKTGSFKVRGVFNRLRMLSVEERERGVIGISAGNHAQALAYGAAAERVQCTVVMPAHASQTKVDASRGYGAEVILHGNVFEAFAYMEQLRDERGLTLVHPYDDPHVIAGQGTAGLEIMEDVPDAAVVIVPIGGGGLISGIAAAVKQLHPSTRVIGIEPTGAPAITVALEKNEPVRLESINTIADGLSAPIAGVNTLAHIKEFVDDVVLVSDDALRAATSLVLERCKILLEPAGAAGIAALIEGKISTKPNQHVVVVASGGNYDLQRLKNDL
ncbi:MAG TPA: threonine/serine dehydratase [Longimicrobiales bacterium]|nr:threonine/serine dehydratase [Longimicrobiales bacterium]